jgi:hypothetical protein
MFQYEYSAKVVHEYRMPPEAQGKAMANGPVPFLFGATAKSLRARYWMRIITPAGAANQVWLEAYPKTLADAQNFMRAEVILTINQNEILPSAVQIFQPAGNARTVYNFWKVIVNPNDFGAIVNDPFRGRVPPGWQKVVEAIPEMSAPGQRPGSGAAAVGDRRANSSR